MTLEPIRSSKFGKGSVVDDEITSLSTDWSSGSPACSVNVTIDYDMIVWVAACGQVWGSAVDNNFVALRVDGSGYFDHWDPGTGDVQDGYVGGGSIMAGYGPDVANRWVTFNSWRGTSPTIRFMNIFAAGGNDTAYVANTPYIMPFQPVGVYFTPGSYTISLDHKLNDNSGGKSMKVRKRRLYVWSEEAL